MKLIPVVNNGKTIYKCDCYNEIYEDLPLCFGVDAPASYYSVPEHERKNRIELEKSLCIIDKKYFFHRGRLTIPILNYDQSLFFDVWTSISEENFERRIDLWEDPDRVNEPPYFGWLNTFIPSYGNTINLKTITQETELGAIPHIIMTEESHPLTIDQQNGITMDKALDIISDALAHNHKA